MNIRDTLFDKLELWAMWDEDWGSYKLSRVTLSYRPTTMYGTEDRRFIPKTYGTTFGRFGTIVQRALANSIELQRFCELVPSNATVQKAFDADLVISNQGFFIKDWPWGCIFDARLVTQKAAALAILELLELEHSLPNERL